MSKYLPLHLHSHYSTLDGLSSMEDIANRIESLGLDGCALTDHRNINGLPDFLTQMKKKGKKAFAGCELDVCDHISTIQTSENKSTSHQVVIAKNMDGYRKLVKLVSHSNRPTSYYYKQRISLEELALYLGPIIMKADPSTGEPYETVEEPDGNMISFSGHMGSTIADLILDQSNGNVLRPDWKKDAVPRALYLEKIFGKGNFMLEVQSYLEGPAHDLLKDCVRELSKETGIPCIATCDAHYASPEQSGLHQALICTQPPQRTMASLKHEIKMVNQGVPGFKDDWKHTFFRSERFYVPSYEEMLKWGSTEEELSNTLKIMEGAEEIDIFHKPSFPKMECPEGLNEDTFLQQICREGWSEKITSLVMKDPSLKPIYTERIKRELDVIQKANLSGYFLIVWDIIQFCKKEDILIGVSRGCFTGDVLVQTNENFKHLRDIEVGDYVVGKQCLFNKVIRKFEYIIEEEMIQFGYFDRIHEKMCLSIGTLDHLILIKREDVIDYVKACDLKVGDEICTPVYRNPLHQGGHPGYRHSVIEYVSKEHKAQYKVYDLEVENDPSYTVNYAIVHNSAGGSLVSALMGLITLDPVKEDLIFERFYNEGRNTEDRIAIPDFDLDIQASDKDRVINYIRSTYGEDRVAQMATFTTIKGRSAMKDVCRAYGIDERTANRISQEIPDETKIKEDLSEMEEELGYSSLIYWALDNTPDKLSEWCWLEKDETTGKMKFAGINVDVSEVVGKQQIVTRVNYADIFRTASLMEGVYRGIGKHAAGVVISDTPLEETVPMINQQGTIIAGYDMKNLEKCGKVKWDILGVSVWDSIKTMQNYFATREFKVYAKEE